MKLRIRDLRKLALSSAAFGVAFWASAPAAGAAESGWYIGLGGGLSLPDDVDVAGDLTVGGTVVHRATATRDASFRGLAAIGYRWQQHLRFEGEIGYSDPAISALSAGGNTASVSGADLSEVTLFGNLLYDLPVAEDLSLTLGGGLGVGFAGLDSGTVKTNDNGFAFQTITGLSYRWNENLELAFDYRYVRVNGLRYGGASSDIASHNLMLSLRWFFEQAETPAGTPPAISKPAAPPQPPAPPPPPPSPPPVKTYIVFFDFNKSYLTDAAQSVVAEAVKVAKTTGMVKVQIAGHTDTVGADDYNMKLSLARAATVKDEMTRLGMDGKAIAVEGKGYHDPLLATGPNVREPQNRRAVIDLGT